MQQCNLKHRTQAAKASKPEADAKEVGKEGVTEDGAGTDAAPAEAKGITKEKKDEKEGNKVGRDTPLLEMAVMLHRSHTLYMLVNPDAQGFGALVQHQCPTSQSIGLAGGGGGEQCG